MEGVEVRERTESRNRHNTKDLRRKE